MFDDFVPEEYIEPKMVENLNSVVLDVLENKQPFGLVIDGPPGMAKTTTAAVIGKFFQPNFDVEKQIGRGVEQFIKSYNYSIDHVKATKKVFSDGKRSVTTSVKVCIYDEANDSDKSGSLGRIQRILNQLLAATSRQEKIVIIVILHRFYRLDEKFYDNSLIHMLINLHSKVNDKYTRFRAFDIDCLLWMSALIKKGKILKKPEVYKQSLPNFRGSFYAPPDDFCLEVEKFSKAGKDLLRKKNTRDILASTYYSVSVLSSMLGVSKNRINYLIDSLGLKDKYLREKSGKIFYYDKEIFAILKGVSKAQDK